MPIFLNHMSLLMHRTGHIHNLGSCVLAIGGRSLFFHWQQKALVPAILPSHTMAAAYPIMIDFGSLLGLGTPEKQQKRAGNGTEDPTPEKQSMGQETPVLSDSEESDSPEADGDCIDYRSRLGSRPRQRRSTQGGIRKTFNKNRKTLNVKQTQMMKKWRPSDDKWYPGKKIPGDLAQSDVQKTLQSFWRMHREEWSEEEPQLKHIIEMPGEVSEYCLACAICMAYRMAHPEDKGCKRCMLAMGKHTHVRKADLLRHVQGGSRTLHMRALAWKKENDGAMEAQAKEDSRLSTMHPIFRDCVSVRVLVLKF